MSEETISTVLAEYDATNPPPGAPEPQAEAVPAVEAKPEETPEEKAAEKDLLDKLLEGYGGNREALAQAVVDSRNEAARLHDRLQVVESKLDGGKEEPLTNEQLEELESSAKQLEAEIQTAQQQRDYITSQFGSLRDEIAQLTGELKYADDSLKQGLQIQLAQKKSDLQSLTLHYNTVENTIKSFQRDARQVAKAQKDVVSQLQEQRQSQREYQQKVQADLRSFHEVYTNAIAEEVKDMADPKWAAWTLQSQLQAIIASQGDEGLTNEQTLKIVRGLGADLKRLSPSIGKEKAKVTTTPVMKPVETPGGQAGSSIPDTPEARRAHYNRMAKWGLDRAMSVTNRR